MAAAREEEKPTHKRGDGCLLSASLVRSVSHFCYLAYSLCQMGLEHSLPSDEREITPIRRASRSSILARHTRQLHALFPSAPTLRSAITSHTMHTHTHTRATHTRTRTLLLMVRWYCLVLPMPIDALSQAILCSEKLFLFLITISSQTSLCSNKCKRFKAPLLNTHAVYG